jgi:ABC-type branched-subunit amino acid transport system substrate-binding protein
MLAASMLFMGCQGKKENSIKVACNLPMTVYVGYYGEWIQNGISAACEELASEMEKSGIAFTFDYQDNKGETKEAVTIFQKQMMSSPDVYMSGITSQTMAIIDQVEKKQTMHVLWSWTPLQISEGKNEFRCWVNYGQEGMHLADYVCSKSPAKVAYVYLNILGAKVQCQEVVLPALKKACPDVKLYVEEYPIESADFKNIMMKVKAFDADVIVLSGFKDHLLNMIKDVDAYGISRDKVICSMDLLDAINDVSLDRFEGLHVTAPEFNISGMHSEYTKQWIEKFVAKNNRQPLYTEAYGYDFMRTLYEAAKLASENGKTISEAMFDVDMTGVTGHLQYQKNGEMKNNLHVAVFRSAELVVEK